MAVTERAAVAPGLTVWLAGWDVMTGIADCARIVSASKNRRHGSMSMAVRHNPVSADSRASAETPGKNLNEGKVPADVLGAQKKAFN